MFLFAACFEFCNLEEKWLIPSGGNFLPKLWPPFFVLFSVLFSFFMPSGRTESPHLSALHFMPELVVLFSLPFSQLHLFLFCALFVIFSCFSCLLFFCVSFLLVLSSSFCPVRFKKSGRIFTLNSKNPCCLVLLLILSPLSHLAPQAMRYGKSHTDFKYHYNKWPCWIVINTANNSHSKPK